MRTWEPTAAQKPAVQIAAAPRAQNRKFRPLKSKLRRATTCGPDIRFSQTRAFSLIPPWGLYILEPRGLDLHWTRTRRANGPPMPKNDFVKPSPRNAPNHARVPAPRTARPLPTFLYSGSTTRYAARSRREPESHPKKAISAGYRDPGSRRSRANPLWEMSYLTRRARAYAKIPVKLAFEHVECDSNPEPEADSLPYLKVPR